MAGSPYIALLECGHPGHFNPRPHVNDVLWCQGCKEYRKVVEGTLEWTFYCARCRMTRPYGADERQCRRIANRHVTRYAHMVLIKAGDKVVDAVTPQTTNLFTTK